MKKIKISLAAITLVLAIAGTTTATANKAKKDLPPCSDFDPEQTICIGGSDHECCRWHNDPNGVFNYP